MDSGDVMSTPINELGNSSEENISENVMKNYQSLDNTESQQMEQLSTPITNYNDVDINPPKPLKKSTKTSKMPKLNKKKCSKPNNLMCLLKPTLIVFFIILLFSYPLFDVKILKLIPKTLSDYDNITMIGLFIKALLGSLLFAISYKFI